MPSSAGKGWGRHWGAFKLLYYHCNTTKIDGLWCRAVPRSAEQCRGVSSSAGKGWGRHWGAFKLLYYHCNTTKIDGLWCRGVPRSAEWGRHWGAFKLLYYHCNTGVPRSAEECRVVPGRGGADIGEPLNYSTTIAIPLKCGLWCRGVSRSAEECRGVPSSAGKGWGWGRHWGAFKLLYYHCNTTKIDGLWCRKVPRGVPRSAEYCREGVGQTLGSL